MTTTLPLVDPILDARALRALQALGPEPAEWVEPTAGVDYDVAIIGGGQNGVALTFALRRLGVRRVTVIDAAPAGRAGVWRSPARMNVLRTPKTLVGPELGVSELSFRHWFEARHGQEAYDAIGYIRRLDWADYLDWFREISRVPVREETMLTRVEAQGEHLRLHLRSRGVETVETVRKLVLSTGVVGFGGPNIPELLRENLEKARYSHTSEAIDFTAFKGKQIAILGSAASAFDAAAEALECGAAEVRLFSRRPEIANKAPARLRGYQGAVQSFAMLPDEVRWKMNLAAKRSGTTPPREALLRLSQQPHFHVHLNAQWRKIWIEGGKILFSDGDDTRTADHIIVGTGYVSDAAAQSELSGIAQDIATWGDRYPAPGGGDAEMARAPYLGLDYQLQEKLPGQAPYLKNIHVYSAAASVSFGRPVGDVPCMGECLPKLARALANDLYFQDAAAHWQRAEQAAPEEFPATLYAHAVR